MIYESSLVDDILKQADIVNVISSYINVIQKGRNYVALCPFHDDKNPSMMISKDKQIFKCFV
ncbi:MAG: CHC2 zinc finger domain-containing protein, partial [Bacilli bacterium]